MSLTTTETITVSGIEIRKPATLSQALTDFQKPIYKKIYGEDFERVFTEETMFARQLVDANPKLANDLTGLMTACANVAITGLSLNKSMGLAYLVMRGGKTLLDVGYKGFCKIVYDEYGIIIQADTIHDCDEWEVTRGLDANLFHKPNNSASNAMSQVRFS